MAARELGNTQGAGKHAPEDHDDDEHVPAKKAEEGEGPWLVSYADLMTLLMGFFALLSSMSSPDQEKIEKAKESAIEVFGGTYQSPYDELSKGLEKFILDNGLKDQVKLATSIQGIELTFSGTLFFESGEIIVKENAAQIMSRLAEKIKSEPKPYKALIEGHTDSIPIRHSIIASNWELSGLRAARIAQIFEQSGFKKDQLTIIGWGETKPVATEFSPDGAPIPENLAKNRRVVLKVYDSSISKEPIQ